MKTITIIRNNVALTFLEHPDSLYKIDPKTEPAHIAQFLGITEEECLRKQYK